MKDGESAQYSLSCDVHTFRINAIDRFDHLFVQLEGGEHFLGDVGHCVPQSRTDGLYRGLQIHTAVYHTLIYRQLVEEIHGYPINKKESFICV